MDTPKSTVLLKHHLKQLKLPTMLAECEKVAARAGKENLDQLAFLLQLCELELIDRERRAADRRLKAARFPSHKTLDTFDFKSRPSVNKPLVLELARGEYLLVAYSCCTAGKVNHSRSDHTWSVKPAARAGVCGSHRLSGPR